MASRKESVCILSLLGSFAFPVEGKQRICQGQRKVCFLLERKDFSQELVMVLDSLHHSWGGGSCARTPPIFYAHRRPCKSRCRKRGIKRAAHTLAAEQSRRQSVLAHSGCLKPGSEEGGRIMAQSYGPVALVLYTNVLLEQQPLFASLCSATAGAAAGKVFPHPVAWYRPSAIGVLLEEGQGLGRIEGGQGRSHQQQQCFYIPNPPS